MVSPDRNFQPSSHPNSLFPFGSKSMLTDFSWFSLSFRTVTVIVSLLGVWLLKIATFPSPQADSRIVITTGTKGVLMPQPVNSPSVETYRLKVVIKSTIHLRLLKFACIFIPSQNRTTIRKNLKSLIKLLTIKTSK